MITQTFTKTTTAAAAERDAYFEECLLRFMCREVCSLVPFEFANHFQLAT
jgi:hypothetical protein